MTKEVHGGNIYKFDKKMIDFSANLNPLGMPEEARDAIISNIDKYESYPDPECRELRAAVSKFHNVDPEKLSFGNGAADIIFKIALSFKPKRALIVEPTFSEYEEALSLANTEIDYYMLKEEEGFKLNMDGLVEKIEAEKENPYDMVFICNPNNPTGIPVEREKILKLADATKKTGAKLVIDQCFSEFVLEEEKYSVLEDIENLEGVIILKAFTKIFAMAGLRLGYCVCSDAEVAEQISSILQPWSVSTAASKAGTAALSKQGFIEETKAYIKKERTYLVENLKNLGITVYDTEANYVFFKTEKEIINPLLEKGFMVRSCANYPSLDGRFYRIAVRTEAENKELIQALNNIF